ncbi:MAG: hypothetical protein GYA34_10115 [Chloroflexi bacterium]|nr:hypothetical protein [Chloroflexota bacterium]
MSNNNSIILRVLGVILLIVIILGGGAAAFMAGQAQGYQLGAIAAGNPSAVTEQGSALPPAAWNPFWGNVGFFPFFHIGGIFAFLGMVLLFLFLLRLVFFPFRWHLMNGDYYLRHWHKHPCGNGPWDEEPKEEKPSKEAKA